MRKAGINVILTLSVAGSILAGIVILVLYASTASYTMSTSPNIPA